ncbi:MAG: head-tail connector protein [Methyloceanibacter sp.]
MPLTTITPAVAEPVSLAEAKAFAKVENTAEDDLIETLIAAATEHVQNMTGRQLEVATYLLTLRCFPHDCLIRLPRSPVVEVESVKYQNSDGILQTLVADTDYLVDAAAEPATVEPVTALPATGEYPDSVQVQFVAGYEPTADSPPVSTVPKRARVAIMALMTHWHEHRPAGDVSQIHETPLHVSRLIAGLRVGGAL